MDGANEEKSLSLAKRPRGRPSSDRVTENMNGFGALFLKFASFGLGYGDDSIGECRKRDFFLEDLFGFLEG